MPNARDPQHHTAVVGRDYFEHKRYVATCSCGWVGHTSESKAEAEHEATDHVVAAK